MHRIWHTHRSGFCQVGGCFRIWFCSAAAIELQCADDKKYIYIQLHNYIYIQYILSIHGHNYITKTCHSHPNSQTLTFKVRQPSIQHTHLLHTRDWETNLGSNHQPFFAATKYWECLACFLNCHLWVFQNSLPHPAHPAHPEKSCLWWSKQEANLVSNRTPKLCEQIEACILSHTASSKYLIPSDPMEGKTWYLLGLCAPGRYDVNQAPNWVSHTGFRFIAHLDTWTLEQYGTRWNNHLSRLWDDFSYTMLYQPSPANTLPPSCMKALAMEMYNKDKMKGGATWWIRPSKYLPHDSHMTTWPASFFERNGVHLDSKLYDFTSLH